MANWRRSCQRESFFLLRDHNKVSLDSFLSPHSEEVYRFELAVLRENQLQGWVLIWFWQLLNCLVYTCRVLAGIDTFDKRVIVSTQPLVAFASHATSNTAQTKGNSDDLLPRLAILRLRITHAVQPL